MMMPVPFCAQFSCCVCRRMAVVTLLVQPYLSGGTSALHISIHFGTCLDLSDDTEWNLSKVVTKQAHKEVRKCRCVANSTPLPWKLFQPQRGVMGKCAKTSPFLAHRRWQGRFTVLCQPWNIKDDDSTSKISLERPRGHTSFLWLKKEVSSIL